MLDKLARYHPLLPDTAIVLLLLLAAWLAYLFASRILLAAVHKVAARTAQTWDDALVANRVGAKLAQLAPVFIIYLGVNHLPVMEESVKTLVLNLTSAYMVVAVTITLIALLNALNDIYEAHPDARQRPIKL